MKNKSIKYILSLTIFSVLLMVGCGGSSQKVLTQESPEAAVMKYAQSWRTSGDSPKIMLDSNGDFVKQIRTGSDIDSSSSDSGSKTIYLKDLDGSDTFPIVIFTSKIINNGNKAVIPCHFVYDESQYTSNSGYLNITFYMVFEENKWWIEDIKVESGSSSGGDDPTPTPTPGPGPDNPTPTPGPGPEPEPVVTKYGVSGYVKSSEGFLNGITVSIFKNDNLSKAIDTYITGSDVNKPTGYYEFDLESKGYSGGTYLLVFSGNGFESKTQEVIVSETKSNVTRNCRF